MPFLSTSASPPTRRSNVNSNHHSPAGNTRNSRENIPISTGSHGDDNDIGQRHHSPRKIREHEPATATASGRLIASHPNTATPSASSTSATLHSPPKPKPKPVFKMKRTGHSGPSPSSANAGPKLPKPQPKLEPDSDIIAMGDIQDSDLIKVQLAMDALSASRATRSKTQAPPKPPTIDPSTEALDASAYKVWKDQDTGKLLPTCGALLPPGYEQSDHPELPWICPVRSYRALLPGLPNLGRHFLVLHRACRLNDNLDGTLTDLGRYANPTPGNGRRFGGTTKSCIIVSKKYMSLAESPMVEPKPYTPHAHNKSLPVQEVPKRELRRRSPIDESETIQVSAMSDDDELDPQDEVKGAIVPSNEGPTDQILVTAKSGRPYNMWPGQFFPHSLSLSNLANRLNRPVRGVERFTRPLIAGRMDPLYGASHPPMDMPSQIMLIPIQRQVSPCQSLQDEILRLPAQ